MPKYGTNQKLGSSGWVIRRMFTLYGKQGYARGIWQNGFANPRKCVRGIRPLRSEYWQYYRDRSGRSSGDTSKVKDFTWVKGIEKPLF
jgi:hypothetical protein